MSYYTTEGDNGNSNYFGNARASPNRGRRRRVVNCVGPEEETGVETYYADDSKSNDPLKYTTCMSHHVMARIEDDVKRAQMREKNPDSAIPSKGYEYDMDAYRAVEEYRATQQLPRSTNTVAAMLYTPSRNESGFLPSISPSANKSRATSNTNSAQPSRSTSNANSPSKRSRKTAQPHSARPSRSSSRTPKQAAQYPHAYRSPNKSQAKSSRSSSSHPRVPAGGRLQPLDQLDYTPTAQSGGYRDDGRVVEAVDGHHAKANKKLFLEPASLADEETGAAVETDRERRLRLAEELAQQMEAEGM